METFHFHSDHYIYLLGFKKICIASYYNEIDFVYLKYWMRRPSFRKFLCDECGREQEQQPAWPGQSQSLQPWACLLTLRGNFSRKPRILKFRKKCQDQQHPLLFSSDLKIAENDCRGSRWSSVDWGAGALHG